MMSNAILSQICDDENDTMLNVKMYCKHGDLLQCKLHGQKTIQVADFGLVHDIVYVCLFLKYLEISDLFIFLIKIYLFVVF